MSKMSLHDPFEHLKHKLCPKERLGIKLANTLLTPCKTQKWVQVQDNGRGGRVGAHSLAHNTLRGRGTCWSFGMRLGRFDKLHSFTQACTQPTQGG